MSLQCWWMKEEKHVIYLDLHKAFHTVPSSTQSPSWRDVYLTDGPFGGLGIGWMVSKSHSHQFSVHVETSDECCSSDLHRDQHYRISLLVTGTVGLRAPPAHLPMARSCVVQSCAGEKGRGIQRDLDRRGGTVPASWIQQDQGKGPAPGLG